MNKKLLLVLVLIGALLVSFSLVMGAKGPKISSDAERYVKPTPPTRGVALSPSARQKGTASYTPVQGTPTEILAGPVDRSKDLCDLTRAGAIAITQWIWGDEKYAHYEDPEAFGCTSVYPFQVTEITFGMQTYGAESFQAFVSVNELDLTDPTCPKPGADICVSQTYQVDLPGTAYYLITIPLTEECCVYGPYFAEFYIIGAVNLPDAITDDVPVDCHSWNDYRGYWEDLVVDYGWPGGVLLYSQGYTEPQNDCPLPPVGCCQLVGSCAMMTEADCNTAGGAWAGPGATCVGNYCEETGVGCCQIGGNCFSMGQAACEFVGGSFSAPPAACVGNLCVSPGGGCCQFIGSCADMEAGACAAAGGTWEAPPAYCAGTDCEMPPSPPCNLQNDVGTYWHVYGNLVEDGYATYFDPGLVCASPTYPFDIDTVIFELLDIFHSGYPVTWPLDVRVTVYDYISDICAGPVAPVHSELFTIQQAEAGLNGIKRAFSQPVCVYGAFFLGVFLETGTDFQPTFSQTFDDPADSCKAWAYWGGVWYNWAEVAAAFGSYIGYPFIRAHGLTDYAGCPPVQPIQCDTLQYTTGIPLNTLTRPSTAYGGRYYTNERFTAPLAGTVGKASALFSARVGTPDASISLWSDDGFGYPSAQLCSVVVVNPVPINPNWCVVDFTPFNISFAEGEEFHVGFTCPNFLPTPTNQLKLYADAGGYGSDRLGEWVTDFGGWNKFIDLYGVNYDAFINVELCYDEPNFELTASPGSQEINWLQTTSYNVFLKSILGFNLPVTLTVAGFPPSAGTAVFVPNPVVPSGPSTLNIDPVDGPVAAGEYVLTITGTAGAYTHQATVKLKINSPFNQEDVVNFYHGWQWVTNFGAVANDAEESFGWYDETTVLFDGSFVIATTGSDHMALDIYNCHYVNWLASEPLNLYYDATYNANVAYANFFTTEDAISCEYDSVFIVGIMDSCVDFSIKIKVYYNPTTTPIVGMYPALLEDWDIGDAYNDSGDMDPAHNLMYEYDPLAPNKVFGMMKAPFYDDPMYNMVFIRNPQYVWPNSGYCSNAGGFWGLDSLYYLVSTPGFFPASSPDTDFSMLMTAQPINLNPGDRHVEVWIDFGRDTDADGLSWKQWWHRVLRYAGFYRGDVNASDSLEVPALDVTDLVYLINYLYKHGPAPKPYADQGDVNCDHKVDVLDVVYLINWVFVQDPAPPPCDYLRFIPQMWDRPSLFENPAWR